MIEITAATLLFKTPVQSLSLAALGGVTLGIALILMRGRVLLMVCMPPPGPPRAFRCYTTVHPHVLLGSTAILVSLVAWAALWLLSRRRSAVVA